LSYLHRDWPNLRFVLIAHTSAIEVRAIGGNRKPRSPMASRCHVPHATIYARVASLRALAHHLRPHESEGGQVSCRAPAVTLAVVTASLHLWHQLPGPLSQTERASQVARSVSPKNRHSPKISLHRLPPAVQHDRRCVILTCRSYRPPRRTRLYRVRR